MDAAEPGERVEGLHDAGPLRPAAAHAGGIRDHGHVAAAKGVLACTPEIRPRARLAWRSVPVEHFRRRHVVDRGRGRQAVHRQPDAARADRSGIAVLSLETGRWNKIIEGGVYARYLPSGHLVFARDGTLLAVPFNAKTLRVTGRPVPVLTDVYFRPNANIAAFDVAADGTVVYVHQKVAPPGNALVWVTREGDAEPLALDRQA